MEVHALTSDTIMDITGSETDAELIAAGDIDKTFAGTIDLLSAPLGTRILALSNEFFAPASNLIKPSPPISRPGVYIETGAWYDGWETRRHNTAEADFVVFGLGVSSGRVAGVEIDTGFFRGNEAPEISVEGAVLPSLNEHENGVGREREDVIAASKLNVWMPILSRKACGPACRQAWKLSEANEAQTESFTHVRLRMYPDGGIGRFKLYGTVNAVFPNDEEQVFDLAAMVNGGVATSFSDAHFGGASNLLLPGRGVDMGDGWETKRSRGLGHIDWVVIKLGCAGEIGRVVVDTAHFRGNFPQAVRLLAAKEEHEPSGVDDEGWTELLSPQRCSADKEHEFAGGILQHVQGQDYRWVKMVVIPDGGVKRLRIYGRRKV